MVHRRALEVLSARRSIGEARILAVFVATLVACVAPISLAYPAGDETTAPGWVVGSVDDGESTVVTRHTARIDGRRVAYTARIGRIAIRAAETGEALGYIGYVAYRVPSSGRPRPVTFVWNGGPGANSSLLHFSTAGPKLAEGAALVDNADSWLDATDLVMVDPVGTGFGRPARSEYASMFYGTRGDVASVAEFVRVWLLQNGAETSPVFLVGESWGAGRAASVAHALQQRGRMIAGMVLISGGWALNTEYVSSTTRRALAVIDMAAVAWHHGRIDTQFGKTLPEVQGAADEWVRKVYAPALARLAELDDAERDDIARTLSRFTGIPEQRIDRQRLEIPPRQYRTQLLADRGQEAYVFDLRRTSPPGEPARAAILSYLRNDLGFRSGLPYLGLEPGDHGFLPDGKPPMSVGARWDYATADVTPQERKAAMDAAIASGSGPPQLGPPLPATLEALAQNPSLRVLVAGGLYDSFRPCAIGKETERSLPAAMRRSIRFKCYVGGHAMYEDPPTRAELAQDLRKFFSGR